MTARRAFCLVLLLAPYAAMLLVPLYNRAAPEIAGVPFFYWYQLLWIPAGSLLLFFIYRAHDNRRRTGT
jgi:hypothetical protein